MVHRRRVNTLTALTAADNLYSVDIVEFVVLLILGMKLSSLCLGSGTIAMKMERKKTCRR